MQDLNKRVDVTPQTYHDSTAMSIKSKLQKSKVIDTRQKLNNYLKSKYEKNTNSRPERNNSRHDSYSP